MGTSHSVSDHCCERASSLPVKQLRILYLQFDFQLSSPIERWQWQTEVARKRGRFGMEVGAKWMVDKQGEESRWVDTDKR